MTLCNTKPIEFSRCKSRKIQLNFDGGEISSDAGAILLNRADKMSNLTDRIASTVNDPRCKGKIDHLIDEEVPILWPRLWKPQAGSATN